MLRFLGLLLIVLLALAGWGYANAVSDPVLHRISVSVPDWPRGAAPLRVALIGDVHMQGPDMPPDRVARIVAQVNAQHPDLILLAGDFYGDRDLSTRQYSAREIAALLGKLQAPLGVFAVMGNHDHVSDLAGLRRELAEVGIQSLDNRVVRRGVLVLAGLDDAYGRHADYRGVEAAARRMPGPALLLSHTPDVAPHLSGRFPIVLSAHTHCGQIVLPGYGPVEQALRNRRYTCGAIREEGRAIIVTGGLGASVVPLRYGAPPDWWLVRVGGPALTAPR